MSISELRKRRDAHRESLRLRQRALMAEARAYRLDQGMTQRMVADDMGLLQSSVSDLERIAEGDFEGTIMLSTFMTYLAGVGLKLKLERM